MAADEIPSPPPQAAQVFGSRLPLAVRYVGLLGTTGVTHGLIGPREVPRLWERHVLNCAVLERLIPTGCAVVDLGSGAGLPGIPLALARPDLTMELLDPLLRRTRWLEETVAVLGADGVLVRRARAQERTGPAVPVAVARAVASLEKLTGWAFPWLQDGGMLLALKGRRAAEELAASRDTLKRLGVTDAEIEQ